jgi:hypothetical protein
MSNDTQVIDAVNKVIDAVNKALGILEGFLKNRNVQSALIDLNSEGWKIQEEWTALSREKLRETQFKADVEKIDAALKAARQHAEKAKELHRAGKDDEAGKELEEAKKKLEEGKKALEELKEKQKKKQ